MARKPAPDIDLDDEDEEDVSGVYEQEPSRAKLAVLSVTDAAKDAAWLTGQFAARKSGEAARTAGTYIKGHPGGVIGRSLTAVGIATVGIMLGAGALTTAGLLAAGAALGPRRTGIIIGGAIAYAGLGLGWIAAKVWQASPPKLKAVFVTAAAGGVAVAALNMGPVCQAGGNILSGARSSISNMFNNFSLPRFEGFNFRFGSGSGVRPWKGGAVQSQPIDKKNFGPEIEFLTLNGYSPAQAAGILGNMMAESGGNIRAYGDPTKPGGAMGLFQWDASRRAGIKKGTDIDIPTASYGQHMEALVWEMKNLGKKFFDDDHFRTLQTPEDASSYFETRFERCAPGTSDARRSNARKIYDKYMRGEYNNAPRTADISTLDPAMQAPVSRVIDRLRQQGWNPIIDNTMRTQEDQNAKLRDGFSRAQHSFHQIGRAADIVNGPQPGRIGYGWDGEYKDQNHQFWSALGEAAKVEGLTWGGDWKGFRDVAHIQLGKGVVTAEEVTRYNASRGGPRAAM